MNIDTFQLEGSMPDVKDVLDTSHNDKAKLQNNVKIPSCCKVFTHDQA